MNAVSNPPVYAVFGRPVGRSASPALHNAWFARLGIPGVYVALEVPEGREDRVVDAFRTLGLAGANVTVPLKTAVAAQVDALDPDAAATGAVNTLVRDGDRVIGCNTDVAGFRRTLGALRGRRAVIVGAGGAARAVARALDLDGAPYRTLSRSGPDPLVREAFAEAELVVNAASGRPAILDALLPSDVPRLVGMIDLNYWDPDPPGRSLAGSCGVPFRTGAAMLEAQAAEAFARWTGRDPLGSADPVR
jgi:shikimate dehydrogenase